MNLMYLISSLAKLWLFLHALFWCNHVSASTIEPGNENITEDTDANINTTQEDAAFTMKTSTPLLFDFVVATTDITTANFSTVDPLRTREFSCNDSQEEFNATCVTLATTAPNSVGKLFENIDEANVYRLIVEYYFYFANIPGLITNPLAIMMAIFARPFNTTELYILVLSASDLLVNIFRFICAYIDSIYTFPWNDHGCRACQYLVSSTMVFSNYIIVCWTLERLYAVLYPLKLFTLFSIGRVKVVLVALLFSAYALSIPYTFTFYADKSVDEEIVICNNTDLIIKWFYFEAFYFVIIPVCIVVVSNLIIIKTIYANGKRRIKWTNNTNILERRRHEQSRLAVTLVLISAVFVLLHIPYLLALLWYALYPDPLEIFKNSHVDFVRFHLYTYVGLAISQIQNWVNLFIYIFSGKKFRDSFLRIICLTKCRTAQRHTDFIAQSATELTME
ncbi:hypothetical protein DPMN_066587 [Dreissena polymorpha]|uniref:G-protein coupled receptors family 1 profile domain-containing protein n=1 Tax=Dreissena polymorpha TaxID=45954 RepID=A0A9D3YTS6_DREPO|nr:hypothetical protein DPMN_066587 [Dreissena polymorpha]